MTHPTLYLSSEDNQMHVFDMQENHWSQKLYEKVVEGAIKYKVLVKDQELAKKLCIEYLYSTSRDKVIGDDESYRYWCKVKFDEKKDTPYPISGYKVTITFKCWNENNPCHPFEYCGNHKLCDQVAILTPVKEEKEPEYKFPDQDDFETEEEFFEACRRFKKQKQFMEPNSKLVESADNATAFKEAELYFKEFVESICDYFDSDANKDKPFVTSGERTYSIAEISQSIRSGNKVGLDQLQSLMALTIDLVRRGKKKPKAVDEPTEGKGRHAS